MSLNFGKLAYSTSLDRTSAFPLDAKSYFESFAAASAAASSAEEAGSTNTAYYYGQIVSVVENNVASTYVITPAKTLEKLNNTASVFYVGYYFGNKFWSDSTYTIELPKDNTKIYVDLNGTGLYMYYGATIGFKPCASVPDATSEVKGIMKLYGTSGQNTDGTMTQKSITDGVNAIKFVLEQSEDEDGDGEKENILVLDLPWD